jgi:hypothetical protein
MNSTDDTAAPAPDVQGAETDWNVTPDTGWVSAYGGTVIYTDSGAVDHVEFSFAGAHWGSDNE